MFRNKNRKSIESLEEQIRAINIDVRNLHREYQENKKELIELKYPPSFKKGDTIKTNKGVFILSNVELVKDEHFLPFIQGDHFYQYKFFNKKTGDEKIFTQDEINGMSPEKFVKPYFNL